MGGCAQQQGVLTFSIENDHICVWNHSSMCLLVLCQPVYSLVIMFLQRMKQNSKYLISFEKVQPSQMLNEKSSRLPRCSNQLWSIKGSKRDLMVPQGGLGSLRLFPCLGKHTLPNIKSFTSVTGRQAILLLLLDSGSGSFDFTGPFWTHLIDTFTWNYQQGWPSFLSSQYLEALRRFWQSSQNKFEGKRIILPFKLHIH